MDQAGGVALRRHPAGHGHFMARSYQGHRRYPHPIPPLDRHRADHPRSDGHPGTGDGQRGCSEANRRREHGLYFRQCQRECPVLPHYATQYFEMVGNRAIYHDGWVAATTPPEPPWDLGFGKFPDVVNGYTWELYNLAEDFSQNNDLAAKMPDKLRNMQELFLVQATKYQVFPLDNSFTARAAAPRPSATAGRTIFTYPRQSSPLPSTAPPALPVTSY